MSSAPRKISLPQESTPMHSGVIEVLDWRLCECKQRQPPFFVACTHRPTHSNYLGLPDGKLAQPLLYDYYYYYYHYYYYYYYYYYYECCRLGAIRAIFCTIESSTTHTHTYHRNTLAGTATSSEW